MENFGHIKPSSLPIKYKVNLIILYHYCIREVFKLLSTSGLLGYSLNVLCTSGPSREVHKSIVLNAVGYSQNLNGHSKTFCCSKSCRKTYIHMYEHTAAMKIVIHKNKILVWLHSLQNFVRKVVTNSCRCVFHLCKVFQLPRIGHKKAIKYHSQSHSSYESTLQVPRCASYTKEV